jgi:hypothetical protein
MVTEVIPSNFTLAPVDDLTLIEHWCLYRATAWPGLNTSCHIPGPYHEYKRRKRYLLRLPILDVFQYVHSCRMDEFLSCLTYSSVYGYRLCFGQSSGTARGVRPAFELILRTSQAIPSLLFGIFHAHYARFNEIVTICMQEMVSRRSFDDPGSEKGSGAAIFNTLSLVLTQFVISITCLLP